MEPDFQEQHRLSQVYLKQFGYKKNGKWYVSVHQNFKERTENVLIEGFTNETNIFDLPFKDFEIRRHFENNTSKVENFYPKVISNLQNQKQLIKEHKDVLCHFVPSLLCRTKTFRKLIESLIRTPETRNNFIHEITLFKGDNAEINEFLKFFKIDFQLNIIIGVLIDHMVKVLRQFSQVIIRDHDNIGWITSDNPVHLSRNGHYEWIIPIESEIYFPLSKNFCLFMFHEKSEINSNPLRKLRVNKVNQVDFTTFDSITKKIVYGCDEYIIFPIELAPIDITVQKNKSYLS